MLSLMDENFCFQCFCTEKYEKCVRPDKNLSLKAALQGRENKIKRLLCRNLTTGLPDNRASKPWGQAPQSGKSRLAVSTSGARMEHKAWIDSALGMD